MSDKPVVIATYPAVVGVILQARRKELGKSQADIASKAGLNVSTWSRIERGESALTIEQLALVSNELQLTPGDVLRQADDEVAKLRGKGILTVVARLQEDISPSGTTYLPISGASLSAAMGAFDIVGKYFNSVVENIGSLFWKESDDKITMNDQDSDKRKAG